MDCVSPILDIVSRLWDCTTNHAAYISHIGKNLDSLRDVKCELENISKDIETRVEVAEQQQYSQRTNQVKGWLERKQVVVEEANDILQKGDQEIQKKCLGSCCRRNCCSRYKLGKEVIKKIDAVKELIKKGHFDVVADRLPRPVVDERPVESAVVGMDYIFSQVWRCIEDQSVGIIGLYGMGGVGKTTLLKKLNNEFLKTSHDFDVVVIWVVVSREVNLKKIQEAIRKKLQIAVNMRDNEDTDDERAVEIFHALKDKKFALLLDDLWERIDLLTMGIPIGSNVGSKIIFTTRREDVCSQMEAHRRFRVERLSNEAALDLFRLKVGETVLNSHHEIPKLAEIAAGECNGLPITIVTVARAMSNWRTPEEWQREIRVLRRYRLEIPGMEDLVFHKLKFSYDSLSDEILKNCFLYCSLFPEDHNILKDELIELWIGEGFLGEFDDIYDARNHGESIMGRLKQSSLLEKGEFENIVKMHDVLRDMAQKLTLEKEKEILVQVRDGLIKPLGFPRWKDVKRISLWGPNIEFFGETPSCPGLITFLVKNTKLKKFPNTFFESMNTLKVLDLSYNKNLSELPRSICYLIKLHHLNLSYTNLKVLPIEVKNLTQLRILMLDDTKNLEAIPTGLIKSLLSLEVFSRLLRNTVNVLHYDRSLSDIAFLEELECLANISDISLTLSTFGSVLKFKASPKLQSCIKRLTIMCSELESLDISSSTMKGMEHLEALSIRDCQSMRKLKISFEEEGRMQGCMSDCFRKLRYLQIENCPIKELTLLKYAPTLQFLWVDNCPSLKEIIADDFGSAKIEESINILPKLESINLVGLSSLKSICRQAMLLPCLKDVEVINCPNLRKLPFDSDSAKNSLNAIKGSKTWWAQ
uniref:NBS-LRR disease resistance protein NBS45 n=1 Tax=Dimocarpus longan TaxID=128017 RepID=A0A0F6RAM1_9ROSI|nr:NBS-LRR disease resistance protein NBS45 [Dimocarpus longan]